MINLMHGDCLERMKNIPDNSVDMILTDLPYGTTMCHWDTVIDLEKMWEQYLRVSKDNAAIILTAAQPFTSALVMSNPNLFRYDLVWEKGNATGFFNAKLMPLRAHESILVFYKKLPTFNPQKTTGHPLKTAKKKVVKSDCYGKDISLPSYSSTERYPRSVQFFSSDKQKGNFHPTQKPVKLMEWLIKSYTNENETILDSCMGSGTTGVAAIKTNRKFIGIESDENYFNIAKDRINNAMIKE
jgi:DNA modification methylase